MDETNFEKMLFDACERFAKEIEKFKFSLVYESDFRYALYAELVKIMDERGMVNYPLRTEHKYGDNQADFSLGEEHEVAVECKFTYPLWGPSPASALREGKEQLARYLKNGAKKACLVYLDLHSGEGEPASSFIHLEGFSLSGEWRKISTEEGYFCDLLVAMIV